jgi:tetratricopeptide (TPR) repeat protein
VESWVSSGGKHPKKKRRSEWQKKNNKEAERAAREKKAALEADRRAAEAERARRTAAATNTIEGYYVREAPKWQYLTIVRKRGWTKDGGAKEFNIDMNTELIKLGEAGWELVAVTSRSGIMGQQVTTGGATSIAIDYAGFTTNELWVFKRPKPSLPNELVDYLQEEYGFLPNASGASSPPPTPPTKDANQVGDESYLSEVKRLLTEGKQIDAIKIYHRSNPGLNLNEAKDAVDFIALDLEAIQTEDQMNDIPFYEGVLAESRRQGNQKGIANALGALGNLYAGAGDIPQAIEHLKQSLQIYESLGDSSGIAFANYNIGIAYGEGAHDIQEAIPYMENAIVHAPNESVKASWTATLARYQRMKS